MILIMLMTSNRRVMGEFIVKGWLKWLGWTGAGVMLATAAALFLTRGP